MLTKNTSAGWFYLVIVVFGFILYANTLKNQFALDDAIVITQNEFTKQGLKGIDEIFSYDSFVGFWLHSYPNRTPEEIQADKKLVAGGRYRPLSIATFAVEYHLFGENPAVFHFINLLIYIFTAVVLYRFLALLFQNKSQKWWQSIPVIAVLLFMAHPLHTEVVANIKGRDELLAFLGVLLAGIAYVKYLQTKKKIQLVFIFIAMFLALLSKENALTWLIVIWAVAWLLVEKNLKKHILPFLSLLSAVVLFILIRQSVLGWETLSDTKISGELMNNPFLEAQGSQRIGTILFTFWIYLKLLFFPHPLTYDYYPYHISLTPLNSAVPLSMLVLYVGMLMFAVFFMLKNLKSEIRLAYKYFIIIVLMFLAPLSVVSNVFFPVGVFMAERFLYFSSLAFVLLLSIVILYLVDKIRNKTFKNGVVLSVILLVLSLYTYKTIDRNRAWKDDFTLFTTDVKVSVNSAKANTSAGGKLLEKSQELSNPASKNFDKALADVYINQSFVHLEKALEIYPTYVDAMLLLGNAHYQKNKDVAKAIHWDTEILKIRPSHSFAIQNTRSMLNMLVGLFNDGKTPNTADEIILACKNFDEVRENIPEVYRSIGLMYARYKNDFQTAIPYYEKALSLNPKDYDALNGLGVIYGQSGDFPKALELFLKVYELNPQDAQVVFNIAVSYQNTGNVKQAKAWFEKYQSLKKN